MPPGSPQTAANKPVANPQHALKSATARSQVTNGKKFLPGIDQRNEWVRRARDVMALHVADMGGEEAVSQAELSILKRIATLTVELEQMEVRFATEGSSYKAIDLYNRGSANLGRLVRLVGMKRRTKDVTPDLSDYIDGGEA